MVYSDHLPGCGVTMLHAAFKANRTTEQSLEKMLLQTKSKEKPSDFMSFMII